MIQSLIDVGRITRRIDDLASIGRTEDGGVTCLAYSEVEERTFEYLRNELPSGYTVRTDSFGNLYATRHPNADRSIYLGSHLDSVFNGGRYDGRLGVVTALEAIEATNVAGDEPPYPPVLTVFRGEEASRFDVGTLGSRGALGMISPDLLETTDRDGTSVVDAMGEIGYDPGATAGAPTLDPSTVECFLELHVEQGPVLSEADDRVGIVTQIRGPVRHRVTVTGQANHSGATPMRMRRDALAGAAEMVSRIKTIATRADDEGDLVATVGDFIPDSGAINKICEEVSFPIDVRSTDIEYRERINGQIMDAIRAIGDDNELSVDIEFIDSTDPVALDAGLVNILERSARRINTTYQRLPSGGGHDAMNFALNGIPVGMLFTPSPNGISHDPAEDTDNKAVADATAVLAQSLLDYDDS